MTERKRTCVTDTKYCTDANKDDATCICPGLNHSDDMCNGHLCPAMANWGKWGECSKPCGGGTKERKRQLVNKQMIKL